MLFQFRQVLEYILVARTQEIDFKISNNLPFGGPFKVFRGDTNRSAVFYYEWLVYFQLALDFNNFG